MDIFDENLPVDGVVAEDKAIPDIFDAKKRLAIELLGRGDMKMQEIADSVGISSNTLGRWKKDPVFMNEVKLYADRRGMERRGKIMDILNDASYDAVKVMTDLLRSDNEKIRLDAAKAIIDVGRKMNTDKDDAISVSFGSMPVPVMPDKDLQKGEV